MADTGAPWNIPYVEPTDLVRDYPAADEAQADAVAAALDAIPVLAGIGSNVVSVNKNDAFTSTSATYVDVTGLAATITPTLVSSKILIMVDITIATSETDFGAEWLVTDASNNPVVAVASGAQVEGAQSLAQGNLLTRQSKHVVASPGSISPVTFKVRVQNSAGGGRSVFVNRSSNNVRFSVSTITLIEVAA